MLELNDSQLKQLAEFTSNLGLVFFGTSVTPLFTDSGKVDTFLIGSGIFLMFGCVIISLVFLRRIND